VEAPEDVRDLPLDVAFEEVRDAAFALIGVIVEARSEESVVRMAGGMSSSPNSAAVNAAAASRGERCGEDPVCAAAATLVKLRVMRDASAARASDCMRRTARRISGFGRVSIIRLGKKLPWREGEDVGESFTTEVVADDSSLTDVAGLPIEGNNTSASEMVLPFTVTVSAAASLTESKVASLSVSFAFSAAASLTESAAASLTQSVVASLTESVVATFSQESRLAAEFMARRRAEERGA